MATHRRITFAKGTLGRFIQKQGLQLSALRVPPFMICRKQEHPGQRHFILTLRNRSGRFMRIPYSQGAAVREDPEILGVLGDIASDVLLYYDTGSAEEYANAFGGDIEDAEESFKVLQSMAEQLDQLLGPEAYNELLSMARESKGQYEMEGDTRWRRSLTCGS